MLLSIQLKWTCFLYLSILTLVSALFLLSDVDISVPSITSTQTNFALWLCKLLKVLQNNRLFFRYLSALYCPLLDTCTLFGQLHMCDTLYSYSASLSFHFWISVIISHVFQILFQPIIILSKHSTYYNIWPNL